MAKKTFLTNEDKAELEGKIAAKADKSDIPEVDFSESRVLLWENASPQSDFAEQTVAVNYSGYARIAIDFNVFNELDGGTSRFYIVYPTKESITPMKRPNFVWWNNELYFRQIYFNATGILFAKAAHRKSWETGDSTADNGVLIPMKIWGIK